MTPPARCRICGNPLPRAAHLRCPTCRSPRRPPGAPVRACPACSVTLPLSRTRGECPECGAALQAGPPG